MKQVLPGKEKNPLAHKTQFSGSIYWFWAQNTNCSHFQLEPYIRLLSNGVFGPGGVQEPWRRGTEGRGYGHGGDGLGILDVFSKLNDSDSTDTIGTVTFSEGKNPEYNL